MKKMRLLHELEADLCLDCVESDPADRSRFLLGSYELQGEVRAGRTSMRDSEGRSAWSMECSGTLDIKWDARGSCWAQAESEGWLRVCRGAGEEVWKRRVEGGVINLCVGWLGDARFAVGLDSGRVNVWDAESGERALDFEAHAGEVWMATANSSVLLTGADDCKLRAWDVRQSPHVALWSKQYDMGVTCAHFHPTREHLVAVGSYDESISLYDLRRGAKQPLSSVKSGGGGVWRIKWSPFDDFKLAAACMRAGFLTARCSDQDELSVTSVFKEHDPEALGYGIDWLAEDKLACCSFYNKKCAIVQLEAGLD